MKDCPTCQQPKDVEEFNANRARPDGLHGECRHCHRERQRRYTWANLERERRRKREHDRRRREEAKSTGSP